MKLRAISGGVAAIIVAVAIVAGASAYYLGVILPAGRTMATDTMMSTLSTSSVMPSTKTTQTTMSTVSSNVAASSSKSSSQTSSSQAALLHIVAIHVSHSLSGAMVAATCSLTMPAQGASYLKVTNNGTAPAEIVGISFSYVEMMTESGAPTNACTVAVGATEYITMTGIGEDAATAGEIFTVSISGSNGGNAYLEGSFA